MYEPVTTKVTRERCTDQLAHGFRSIALAHTNFPCCKSIVQTSSGSLLVWFTLWYSKLAGAALVQGLTDLRDAPDGPDRAFILATVDLWCSGTSDSVLPVPAA